MIKAQLTNKWAVTRDTKYQLQDKDTKHSCTPTFDPTPTILLLLYTMHCYIIKTHVRYELKTSFKIIWIASLLLTPIFANISIKRSITTDWLVKKIEKYV